MRDKPKPKPKPKPKIGPDKKAVFKQWILSGSIQ